MEEAGQEQTDTGQGRRIDAEQDRTRTGQDKSGQDRKGIQYTIERGLARRSDDD